jgi:polysaccharide export outer membrane protein
MKRLILFFIIVLAGCNGLSSFVNRGGVGLNSAGGVIGVAKDGIGINSAGSVATNPTTTGSTTSSSNINAKTMKDAYLDPLLPARKQSKYAKLIKPIYVIEEKDILNIQVRGEPDLSTTTKVTEKGEIGIPLLDDVKVAGLTLQEAAQLLQNRFKDGYLNDPIVSVEINTKEMLELKEKVVFVSGQVEKPGSIPLVGTYITVFEAINKSGGLGPLAWPSRTKLIRIENGVKSIIKVNIKKIRKGERSLDVILKPDDMIVVPEAIF